jgi:YD repeat-containing protein
MLYGRGGFQAPNVVPGRERLDRGGALRFALGPHAYAAEYDANGNMTSRVVAGQAQLLSWDAENRLVGITQGASVSTFVYRCDGNRVQATVYGVTTTC